MNRAIVLISCLLAAAGIAAYTHFSERSGDQTPVYTAQVLQRPTDPAAPSAPVLPPQKAAATPGDRASLARELQRELKRVGCYSGEISGVWTTSSRMAMKAFTDHANATLPIDNPDYILLSLVQGHKGTVCGAPCPTGQTATEVGRCVPAAVLAKSAVNPIPAETKAEQPAEKSIATAGAVVPATVAAATALVPTAPAIVPKAEPKAPFDDRTHPAAVAPPPKETKTGRPERFARRHGRVPSAGVYEPRSRRHATARPPRFVRNLMRTLGFR